MNDAEIHRQPETIRAIVSDTAAMSFSMISEAKVGSLLAVLAASKPAGRFLELGYGNGSWDGVAAGGNGFGVNARHGRYR
jgi:predicted O-methyltransferase YrrM